MVERPSGVCSPALLTLSSGPLEASHLVVGEQHYRLPIWAVVGFCVSWGQQPAGRGCCRNYLIQPCLTLCPILQVTGVISVSSLVCKIGVRHF